MKNLKIALFQQNIVWHNPTENLNKISSQLEKIKEDVDLIVLPEMFTTGFTMNPETIAETMQGNTVEWMKVAAKKNNCAITGSLVIVENQKYFNRLLFVHPSGEVNQYNKRHLFTLAGEDTIYSAGNKKLIVTYKGWKISPLICYDLRFPVWSRNTENYEILLYVANWPKPRILAWNILLKARAIENMCYTIGVNRVGLDENNYEYTGNSIVFNCLGEALTNIKEGEEVIELLTLSKSHISKNREQFNFLNDKDEFMLP